MTRALEKRLRKLESQMPPPQPTLEEKHRSYFKLFFRLAVAHYLGDPDPEESVYEAYARALGYANPHDMFEASDFSERVALAFRKLLAKLGNGAEDLTEETLKRMAAGLSEQYKGYLRHELRQLGIGDAAAHRLLVME
jgi:hypothetical protein